MSTQHIAFLLLFVAMPALAGHGLMNSFADVEWLPDPGRTPDQWNYRLDDWLHRAALARAADAEARLRLELAFGREKLAEAEAMVRQAKPADAKTAMQAYAESIARAAANTEAVADSAREATRMRYAGALLEHQYIIATDYMDLPRDARTALAAIIEAASKAYTDTRARLPKAVAGALFFKEEEVRWAWEMAREADAQGL